MEKAGKRAPQVDWKTSTVRRKKKVPFFTLATEVSYHCKSVDFVDFKETSQWFLKGKRWESERVWAVRHWCGMHTSEGYISLRIHQRVMTIFTKQSKGGDWRKSRDTSSTQKDGFEIEKQKSFCYLYLLYLTRVENSWERNRQPFKMFKWIIRIVHL